MRTTAALEKPVFYSQLIWLIAHKISINLATAQVIHFSKLFIIKLIYLR
jgi:hypothetical protein